MFSSFALEILAVAKWLWNTLNYSLTAKLHLQAHE